MLKVPEAYLPEFREEMADKLALGARTGCLLLIFLFPTFGLLDWVMYTDIAGSLILLRLIVTPLEVINLMVLTWLLRRRLARRWVQPLSWAILYPAVFALDIMIVKTGGGDSPYYAGLSLVMLGMMVAAPWSAREMSFHGLFIWLQYAIVMIATDHASMDWRIFFSNNFFMLSMVVVGVAWTWSAHDLRMKEFMSRKELGHEKERSEQLLRNILPEEVANELKQTGQVEAKACPNASIMFTDFAGFTAISSRVPASQVVEALHRLFGGFDDIITRHGLEKLKTIGDAYMCVGGLPTEREGHLISTFLAGLEIVDFLERDAQKLGENEIRFKARIGVHAGPVIAGVIGSQKFAYDVWGDSVNLAARLETASEPGRINVSTSLYETVKQYFEGTDRGYLPVKGKGPVAMTFIDRIRPEYSADPLGRFPNQKLLDIISKTPVGQTVVIPVREVVREQLRQTRRQDMQHDLWDQLTELNEADKARLSRIGIPFEFRLGERIVNQGEELNSLFVVGGGHVGVRILQNDTKIDVSVLGPGDLIGDMSFVTGDTASASVVAVEPGWALRLPRLELENAIREDLGFASRLFHALANLMATRLRDTNSRLPPLIVDEVAHTKLHHSTITGQAGSDSIPGFLVDAVDQFKEGMRQLDRALLRAPVATEAHQRQTGELCDRLKAELAKGLAEVSDKGPEFQGGVGSYVFRETFPFFMLSRMIDRSFSKPRGYAGDYYTIELIHLMEPAGDRRLGPLVDKEYLLSPPCQAVRNRRYVMRDALIRLYRDRPLKDANFHITSLASGAGREVFDFMATLEQPKSVFASMLDIDIEALSYSSHLARDLDLQDQVLFAKENVLFMAMGRGKTRLSPQDVIYSIGLADYLKDEIIIRLLNWAFDTLKPGGVCVVGNFSQSNPDKDFMDHILDWRLYHRTPDDMRRLFADSKFGPRGIQVDVEPAGVNLLASCSKN